MIFKDAINACVTNGERYSKTLNGFERGSATALRWD